jgi:hypothetical protein
MARSNMSRATDFGAMSWSATHGCPRRYSSYAALSSSSSGFGYVTPSISSTRWSYSIPSAFIAATASPRALDCCAIST